MSFLCDWFRVPYALAAAVQAFSAVEKTVTSSGQEPTRRRVSRAGTPRRVSSLRIYYPDGLSLCLTCSQETDITTVIQRYPQHPRRTAGRDRSEQVGRDPSEWVVAIVGMPTIDHGTPIESLNRIDGGKVDDDTHHGGKRYCGIECHGLFRSARKTGRPPAASPTPYAAEPANTGTANRPVPTMPSVKTVKAKEPAMGFRASAAWLEVSMSVMPAI